MKRFLFALAIICALNTPAWTQMDYARYYYRMTVGDGSNEVWDHTTNNGNIKMNKTFHAGKNQQWTVMPLYIMKKGGVIETDPAREFIMTTRYNGKVVDVKGSSDAYVYWPFHAGNNQLFKFDPTVTPTVYTLSSPMNFNWVLQRYVYSNELIFLPISSPPTGKQKTIVTKYTSFPYYFTNLQDKRIDAIPGPVAPTSFTQTMPTETPKVFIEEALIPYPFIKNDLAYSLQVEYSPYYKLVHKQYYRRAALNWDVLYFKNSTYTETLQIKEGTKQSEVTEVTTKLDLSFSSTGEVAWKVAGVGLKLSNTIGAAFGKTVKKVSSWEETYEITTTTSRTMNIGALDRRVVTYQLVDYYELYRANDQSTPTLRWEVGTNDIAQVHLEGESSGGGRIAAQTSIEYYTLADGKLISKPGNNDPDQATGPNTGEKEAGLDDGSIDFAVFPNPSKDSYTIQLPNKLDFVTRVLVYDENGVVVFEESGKNRSDKISIISLSHLPAGRYILIVEAGNVVKTERIIKE